MRLRLDQEVLGSNPRGGKGAEGASTGLDWPRAGLERRLSAATHAVGVLGRYLLQRGVEGQRKDEGAKGVTLSVILLLGWHPTVSTP